MRPHPDRPRLSPTQTTEQEPRAPTSQGEDEDVSHFQGTYPWYMSQTQAQYSSPFTFSATANRVGECGSWQGMWHSCGAIGNRHQTQGRGKDMV